MCQVYKCDYIPNMPSMFLSIPEGVSVATVALMGWMWRLRVW